MQKSPSETESDNRVVPLRKTAAYRGPAASHAPGGASPQGEPRIGDLDGYPQTDEADDYRHRMLTNLVGVAVVVLLIAIGIWIADTMASMRKNQDCVLSGRRGCTPVDAPPPRW